MRPAVPFQPTPEQTAVLAHDLQPREVLLLNAYAGAGKSTTLRLLAQAQPRRRFFYVCFNRSVAQAARAAFPANAYCETLHKVARDAVARDYPREKLGVELKPLEIAELLRLRERYVAYWIKRTLQEFLHSVDERPSAKHTHALPLSPGQESMVVDLTERLWAQMSDPESSVPLPHDGYLKLYVMGGYPLRPCDVVLLDEAQDTNPVTTLFLRRQRREQRAVVLVGDRHQAIYGFRGAFNFMEQTDKLRDCTRLSLTSSFRFGQPIADLASDLLNAFKADPVRLRGLGRQERSLTRAFIARTNAGLLEEAENLISAGVSRLHFVGTSERQNYNPAAAYGFSDLLDVYHLRQKQPGLVKSSYFRRFDSYDQLKELASDHRARDLELSRLVAFVDRWQAEVPSLLDRFAAASVSPEAAQATLATAHRAKGLEWDTVRMADDFLDLTEASRQPQDLNEQAFSEEINLLYVAVTRSRTRVELPEHLQRWHQTWRRRVR
ncbi:MAG TPA: UvrD-helicase domain-containing protein [Chthoniobacterales bacterium]